MASIAQRAVTQQGVVGAHDPLNEDDSYRLVVRFGKDLLQDGFTAIPNLLLDCYAELGITHCELVFLLHLMQYKWSRHDPFPSLGTIATKMGLSIRAVQNHVQSLKSKAWRCPHTDNPDECDCPKYLVVTPRYRAGMGQTSNSYNLSGLFAAVLNLAREKGLLPQADPAKSCTPPRASSCIPPVKEVAPESDVSKNTQVESNESFSNALGGKDEVQISCSHEAMATRNPEQETERASPPRPPANRNPEQASHTPSPSSPNRGESSKTEIPPLRAAGRPRQSLDRKDEVIGNRERVKPAAPRMTAPPLTQEDMDVRIRERIARERTRTQMQNPLPGIIRDEDWNTLEQAHPTQPHLRCKPMPVYPQLQREIERISERLGDFHHAKSNITRTDNIRREANVPLEKLLDVLTEAHRATLVADQKGLITKRDKEGRPVKMSYFFACVRQKLGLPPSAQQAV